MLHIDPETLEGALALAAAPGGPQDPFLRAALEAARVGTWRIEIATGLSSWDPVTSAIFGLEPAARVNSEPLLHVHPEDKPAVARHLAECMRDGTSHDVVFRAFRQDGAVRWIRAVARPVAAGEDKPRWVCGTVIDVTEAKAADDALSESERRLSTLLGNLPGIAYRCEIDGPWRLTFVSEGAEAITGWAPEEWIAGAVAWPDTVHPDDHPGLVRAVKRGIADKCRFSHTYRISRRDGALRWMHETGVPIFGADGRAVALEGYVADVTEQKALEEALRASTERAHHILDSVPQIVWSCDAEGRTTYISPQWETFTGVVGSAARLEWASAIHPDDIGRVEADWPLNIAAGKPVEYQYRLRHASGEYRWMLAQAVPEKAADGRIVRWFGTSTDIHESVLAQQALRDAEAVNRSILEASPDCIQMLDRDGRILFVNPLGAAAIGVPDPATLIGLPWIDLLPPDNAPDAREALRLARKGKAAHFTMRWAAPGHARWWDIVATPLRDGEGKVSRIVVASRDITHQKQSEERVRWIANHDSLTGLPNRLLFQERLDHMVHPDEGESHFALLLLDIDEFKRVNDTLGHDAGDGLLCAFAERLKEAARKDDLVARLGGDEFAVILNGVSDEEEVTAAVDAVMRALRRPWVHAGMVLDCDASIGASIFPKDGETRAELMKHADIALYVAKAAGRGNLKLFHAKMRAEMQNRISMLALARDAIDKDWIIPFYQPKVDLRTGEIAGFEALLRWHHPGKGVQSPDTIAAAFEDLTIASGISDRMVDKVIEDVGRWRAAGLDFRHVAINASAAEFRSGDFAERLLERLAKAGVPPHCLQLEVTETVFLGRGADCVERTLKALSAAGLTIALDDFGTGYASLSHLKQFPVDLLKIDRSFVRELGQHPDAAAIIRAVINLGHSLDIEIVAEGIETAAQEARLVAQGCDYGQGYLYSHAVRAAQVPAILAARAERERVVKAG
ncbi:MAG: EAL domain-containing protein [Alphaproteobacteria bacterium]|nr:EAL domain-containing protein [Alphaproteobacteria bacterium]